MARGDQLARQWKILQKLSVSRYGKSASELADSLECHPRTVYRDLHALQVAGFPIYSETISGKNFWAILDDLKHHIPIPFTLTELLALHFSRDMLKSFRDTVLHDPLESLFKKVKTTLPPKSHSYLNELRQTLQVRLPPQQAHGKYKEIINQVNEAAVNRKSLEIVYYAMSTKKQTRRTVDPYLVSFFNGTFYLIGHCHKRGEVRMFALNRIKMLHQTEDSFDVSQDFDLDAFFKPCFGLFQGKPEKVKIWFSPERAGYIAEKIWHSSQKIIQNHDGSLVLELEVAGTTEIKHWIIGWGSHAVVLEPDFLRDEIRKEAKAMVKGYAKQDKHPEWTNNEEEGAQPAGLKR